MTRTTILAVLASAVLAAACAAVVPSPRPVLATAEPVEPIRPEPYETDTGKELS